MNKTLKLLKNKLHLFENNLIKSKKYSVIYLIFIIIASLSLLKINNYIHPKMEIFTIILVSILGIFSITFYSYHDNDKNLYKTAFIIILIFGITCSFLMPMMCAPDEYEHIVRSEITSEGILIPEYKNNSYTTIQSIIELKNVKIERNYNWDILDVKNGTIFTTNIDNKAINYTLKHYHSAFAQNPFYGYIPQAIGMDIAKILNLNTIWLLWLGRICNLILYASLISLAVKKTPILKIPLIVMSCIPLTIYQASSLSIDATINGLGILMIAYFFYMYKLPEKSLGKKEIIVFSIIGLLLTLCKITYFLLIFLILLVPKNNFKNKNYYYNFLSIIIISILGIIWIKYFMTPGLKHSYRGTLTHYNSTKQMQYILNHKRIALVNILNILQNLNNDLIFNVLDLAFNKFNSIYLLFLGAVGLLYPHEKINIKTRIGALIILLLIYIGTYITFLLNWTPVGTLNPIGGVQARYFLPLFVLIPFIFGFNYMDSDKKEINNYIILLTIGFLALMIISLVIKYY